jgi:hypothetical protein
MPIERLLEGRNFDPNSIKVLVEAFNGVAVDLDLRTLADRERAARIIIDLARAQTTLDAGELRDDAVRLMQKEASAPRRRPF